MSIQTTYKFHLSSYSNLDNHENVHEQVWVVLDHFPPGRISLVVFLVVRYKAYCRLPEVKIGKIKK